MTVSSAGKKLYEASGVNKVLFIKNLVEYSDDLVRTVAQDEFWYLNTDNTTMTDNNATNAGIKVRGALSNAGQTVKTVIPLNHYSFFEELSDRLLPPIRLLFDGTGRRIVVTTMQLWVPKLMLTPEGQKQVNKTS